MSGNMKAIVQFKMQIVEDFDLADFLDETEREGTDAEVRERLRAKLTQWVKDNAPESDEAEASLIEGSVEITFPDATS